MKRKSLASILWSAVTLGMAAVGVPSTSRADAPPRRTPAPRPAAADVAYGPHDRCRLDLYLPEGPDDAVPVVVLLHGGGFTKGDKQEWASRDMTAELLARGIACAAVNYPFVDSMPLQDILRHCGRAVQFLRSNADRLRLDSARVGGMGGSAGAGTVLWLAVRDDLADPVADDPVLRQSSRLACAVCIGTQATYDFSRWESFLGDYAGVIDDADAEAARVYHLPSPAALRSERGRSIRRECDMLAWISPDDPPLLLNNPETAERLRSRNEVLHSIEHARAVRAASAAARVECVVLQDHPDPKPRPVDFLIQHLSAVTDHDASGRPPQ